MLILTFTHDFTISEVSTFTIAPIAVHGVSADSTKVTTSVILCTLVIYQKGLSTDGTNWLKMMSINRVSTDLRKRWKEDVKPRRTSS